MRKLGVVQQQIHDVLKAGGFIRVRTGTKSSSPTSRTISLRAVESFTLLDATKRFVRKLTRHQVEGCCKKGIIDYDYTKLPTAGLFKATTNSTLELRAP